uniref:Secreted protein n=1 Tax=Rodentolepis nana TaxID=102285 RepID=A0A0R3T4P1_RODNA
MRIKAKLILVIKILMQRPLCNSSVFKVVYSRHNFSKINESIFRRSFAADSPPSTWAAQKGVKRLSTGCRG